MIPAERKSRSAARTPPKRSPCSTTAISMMTTTGRTSPDEHEGQTTGFQNGFEPRPRRAVRRLMTDHPGEAERHGHDHLVAAAPTRTDPSPRRRRNTGPSTVLDRTTRSSRSSSVLSDEGQGVGPHLTLNKKYQL